MKVGSWVVEIDPDITESFEFSDFKRNNWFLEFTLLWKGNLHRPSELRWVSYNKKGVNLNSDSLRFGVAPTQGEPCRAEAYIMDDDASVIKIGTSSSLRAARND